MNSAEENVNIAENGGINEQMPSGELNMNFSSSGSFSKKKRFCSVLAFSLICGSMILYLVTSSSFGVTKLNVFARYLEEPQPSIRVCVQEMQLTSPVTSEGALVECYDKDLITDDFLVSGLTGTDGCVTMSFNAPPYFGWDPVLGGPDAYCIVTKEGFVFSTPGLEKDYDSSNQIATFEATLFRDRSNDYGTINGCGPQSLDDFPIDIINAILPFDDQCDMHDKCYSDCQIYLAEGSEFKGQKFCDYEMYEGMKSLCYKEYGKLRDESLEKCIDLATLIHNSLRALGFTSYELSDLCPTDSSGLLHPSMNNIYD